MAWKKGETGCPGGVPKAYRHFDGKALKHIFGICAAASERELKRILESPNSTRMEFIVASTFARAIEERSAKEITYLLDRFIPKPKDPINVQVQLEAMSDEELIRITQEHIRSMSPEPETLTIEAVSSDTPDENTDFPEDE